MPSDQRLAQRWSIPLEQGLTDWLMDELEVSLGLNFRSLDDGTEFTIAHRFISTGRDTALLVVSRDPVSLEVSFGFVSTDATDTAVQHQWRDRVQQALDQVLVVSQRSNNSVPLPVDTFFAYIGVYGATSDALTDYDAIKDLHTELGLIGAFDAAIIERREDGKVRIVKKHETPTRVGGVVGGGIGLATGLVIALFPAAAIGTGLLAGTTASGAVLGAIAGRAAAGMYRRDLKDLGEALDAGQAGLVAVSVADMEARIERAMQHAAKTDKREFRADPNSIEADVRLETS